MFFFPWQTAWVYHERFLGGVTWQYAIEQFYLVEIFLWGAVCCLFIYYVRRLFFLRSSIALRLTRDRIFFLSLLGFCIFVFSSLVWATDSRIAYNHAFHLLEGGLVFLCLFVGPISFSRVCALFSFGAVVPSILGIWQFFSQSTFSFSLLGLSKHPVIEAGTSVIVSSGGERLLRAYGSFPHPNIFGGYLVLVLMCMMCLYFFSRVRYQRYGILLGICFFTATLFLTFSRSAMLSFLCSIFLLCVLIFVFFRRNKKVFLRLCTLIVCVGIVLVGFVALYPSFVYNRIHGVGATEVRSLDERLSSFSDAKYLFSTAPIIGVGVGNYTAALTFVYPNLPAWAYQPVHNVFFLILVELGIVGFVGIACMSVLYILFLSFCGAKIHRVFLFILFLFPILPLLLFDHYLWSLFPGVMLLAVYVALFGRLSTHRTPVIHIV
ncbi:MAG: O-antigen ligase family protein [Candidatus Magasanikbacteria bacterium]|nr:O-antigen ligase family protein [Candidatus Magasanikbacteria bacterium]